MTNTNATMTDIGLTTTDDRGIKHYWFEVFYTAQGEDFERVRVVRDDNVVQECELILAEGGTWRTIHFAL